VCIVFCLFAFLHMVAGLTTEMEGL